MEWPYPAGTYVTAQIGGIPLREKCRNHIWELRSDPQPVDYGCGFIQCAWCLVCGGAVTPPLDADFFTHKVNAFDVAGCFGEIHEAIEWLTEVRTRLEAWWNNGGETPETPALKDFG